MDTNRYAELKAADAVSLEMYQDDPVKVLVRSKRFDPETGAQLEDHVIELNIDALKADRESLLARIAEIDELLADSDNCIDAARAIAIEHAKEEKL
jgi:hypothetical protein